MKEVRCADVGAFGECDGVIRGEDEHEVLDKVAQHVVAVHGAELDASAAEHVRAQIHDVASEGDSAGLER